MRDGVYSVSVDWTNAAWQHARWSMTASVYKSDILTYSDGHYWLQSFTDDTHYTIDDERLNGTGSFYMENNKLHWVNDMTGENIVLIPA